MNVAKLCHRNVVTVEPSDELITAARLMRERHVGYLVVVESGAAEGSVKPVGVLTDRDIVVAVVARDADAHALRVGDVMTSDLVLAAETDSLDKALGEMRRAGVRRLPIVGNRGQLIGVLSIDDILGALAGELANVSGAIRNEQRIEGTLRP